MDDDSDGDDDDNASAASSAKRSTKSKKTSKKISLKDVMTISSDTEIADNDAALAYAKTTQTLLQDAITNVQKELHCAKGNKNVSKTIQELTEDAPDTMLRTTLHTTLKLLCVRRLYCTSSHV